MKSADVERAALEFLNRTVDTIKTAGRVIMSDFDTLGLAAHIETFLRKHGLRKDTED